MTNASFTSLFSGLVALANLARQHSTCHCSRLKSRMCDDASCCMPHARNACHRGHYAHQNVCADAENSTRNMTRPATEQTAVAYMQTAVEYMSATQMQTCIRIHVKRLSNSCLHLCRIHVCICAQHCDTDKHNHRYTQSDATAPHSRKEAFKLQLFTCVLTWALRCKGTYLPCCFHLLPCCFHLLPSNPTAHLTTAADLYRLRLVTQ